MAEADVTMIPQNYVELTDEAAVKNSSRRRWIFWKRMTMCSMFIITGMNKKEFLQAGRHLKKCRPC